MFASFYNGNWDSFGRSREAIDSNSSRLRTAVEANAASGAIVADIARRMHAVMAQFR
jgi:hypothetical protein